MKAELWFHQKVVAGDSIYEIKIWKTPKSPERPEGFKYSLAYIIAGSRIIGYDNAEGKGHHRHVGKIEEPYRFVSPAKLIADFAKDVNAYTAAKGK